MEWCVVAADELSHLFRYLGTSALSTLEVLCDRNTTPAVSGALH